MGRDGMAQCAHMNIFVNDQLNVFCTPPLSRTIVFPSRICGGLAPEKIKVDDDLFPNK
jgi:hypothetical protein